LKAAEEVAAKVVADAISAAADPPLVPPLVTPGGGSGSEFTPSSSTKKPRRALGLAVGLSNLAAGGSVMVESVKNGFT
jgi:hypothetical protein